MDGNIDNLTGLYAETSLEEIFTREISRIQRYHRPLTLILIDMGISESDFQKIGYYALKNIANVIRNNMRQTDIKIRIKNRILVIAPETGFDGAVKAAKNIKDNLEKIVFSDYPEIKLTAKIGIAACHKDKYKENYDYKNALEILERDLEIPLDKKIDKQ